MVAFAFARFAFGVRFALAGLFVLLLALPLAFSFSFLFLGRLGLFSLPLPLPLTELLAFRLSSSAGLTVSGASPAFVALLMSIATVCPALTTSPGLGN